MAEDPGVGTLSAVIEAMRQLFNFVQDTAKSIVNTGADIARTYLCMSWRKNKHGRQGQAREGSAGGLPNRRGASAARPGQEGGAQAGSPEEQGRNENENRAKGPHARAQGSISHARLLNRTIGRHHVKPLNCEIMRKTPCCSLEPCRVELQ